MDLGSFSWLGLQQEENSMEELSRMLKTVSMLGGAAPWNKNEQQQCAYVKFLRE